VFAITKREAEQLRPKLREKNKIKIVGEFFSNAHIDSVHVNRHRELFGLPADKKIVTMLGGIREIKGTIDFLRAAQLVMSKHDNTVFVIAGKGYRNGLLHEREYFDECMKVVEILRERGLIYMLGEITNPLELIATSDILVSPSPQTHFSRPVIEAWGFTKPVIAARTDHMQDLINDGVNGLLIPVGDHDALANYLCLLLDNSELCQRLGREGRKKTDAEFDADTNLQRIVDTCDSMSFIRR